MKLFQLFSLLFFILSTSAFGQDTTKLEKLLCVDRFHAYIQRWSQTMEGRNKKEIGALMKAVTPEEIAALKVPEKRLADPFEYDGMILELVQKKKPALAVKRSDVAWEYNFYKRKLAEAYSVGDAKITPLKAPVIETGLKGESAVVPKVPVDELLLNADGYVSGRTTRAIFWEASQTSRPIELHVGTAGDFRASIADRGARVIGQVKTVERNYNPIYLIQLPGEKEYRYAVTEISGADRLRHFQLQTDVIRWKGIESKPTLEVFGKAADLLEWEELELKRVMDNLPKADKVIIGQKGALERSLSAYAKNEASLSLLQQYPKDALATLTPELQKSANLLMKDPTALSPLSRKALTDAEDLYEALKPVLEKKNMPLAENFTVFNLDRGSYEMSDYLLKDARGNIKRWRIFSNSWGDEVVPVARALKATGHNEIIYIGTAGAFSEKGLGVGDLVIPSGAVDKTGDFMKFRHSGPIPEMAKEVEAVINVSSPFEETQEWLKQAKRSSQVVEIETSYLASVFNGKNDKVTPYLLISDVVGSEGETLAEASSASRVKAQQSVLAALFEEADIRAVSSAALDRENKLASWMSELAPNRDEVSGFQIIRKANLSGISTKADFAKFLKTQKSFTTTKLESSLLEGGKRLEVLLAQTGDFAPRLSVSKDFVEGVWNPAEPISIHLRVSSKKAEDALLAALAKLRTSDKKFASFLDVSVSRDAAQASRFINVPKLTDFGQEALLEMYKDTALGFGGLATTETRTGSLKFVKVAPMTEGRAQSTLAFFAPNPATTEILSELENAGAQKFLTKEIAAMNEFAGPNKPWKIKLTVVKDLVGNHLAQIVPELAGEAENLTIHLKLTEAGLSNPAIVMEEMIHLQQITGAPVPWKHNTQFKAFVHPYHWAEVVANAQAGSVQAAEKIARLEIEAAEAADDAVSYYIKQGLFKSDRELIEKYLSARKEHAEELYASAARLAKQDQKAKNAAWDRARGVFDELEAQSVKLNDLVAKNDRAGVRKMVEKYLPWDLMEPSEKKAWVNWLEAMEKPNPAKTKLVFRGMYDDLVMRNSKGEVYLMSTVLTKNQGSYTRRLRSLATMREKFGMKALRDSYSAYDLGKNPGSISVMMANHAIEAKGSPFLSTASYDVAAKFGPRRLGAFEIDERRLIFNALSPDKYLYQHEMLTPLFIFPDEVVHYHDYALNPVAGVGPKQPALRKEHFISELEKKLGRKVTSAEIAGLGDEEDFLKTSYKKLTDMVLDKNKLPMASGPGCSVDKKGCDCLYKALNVLLQ